MVEELLSDRERHLLMQLVAREMAPLDAADPGLLALFSKLHGTDTVIVARRAYPSRGGGDG